MPGHNFPRSDLGDLTRAESSGVIYSRLPGSGECRCSPQSPPELPTTAGKIHFVFRIPAALDWLNGSENGRKWLSELPTHVAACVKSWGLDLAEPYERSFVSIVFPAKCSDGSPAVLKIQYPHPESEHEAEALRLWKGEGAVRLFDHAPEHHALLIERCEPGDHLSSVRAEEAMVVLVQLLPRLWVKAGRPFRLLEEESDDWRLKLPSNWEQAGRPFEVALLDAALEGLDRLRGDQGELFLLHQDLHGDNILRSAREPWLVIDPKPLAGEREFSLAPIVRAYEFGHNHVNVIGRLDRLSMALRVDRERARLWTLGQTLAWAFEGKHLHKMHVETARWLWQA